MNVGEKSAHGKFQIISSTKHSGQLTTNIAQRFFLRDVLGGSTDHDSQLDFIVHLVDSNGRHADRIARVLN